MKIKQTKCSSNSEWTDIVYHNKNTNYEIRVVDDTDDNTIKSVFVILVNVEAEEEKLVFWQNLKVSPGKPAYFNFFLSYFILDGTGYHQITTGRKYSANSHEDLGDASGGSIIEIYNDSEETATFAITKGRNATNDYNLEGGETLTLGFLPKLIIHATNGEIPAREDFNTEISLLGIISTDIVISKTEDVYSFSLSNIVF